MYSHISANSFSPICMSTDFRACLTVLSKSSLDTNPFPSLSNFLKASSAWDQLVLTGRIAAIFLSASSASVSSLLTGSPAARAKTIAMAPKKIIPFILIASQ